jgi:hypothetical protein
MTGARPRREQEENLCPLLARDGVALVGLEVRERAGRRLDLLAAAADPRSALDDKDPGVLLDLVVAELLPRIDPYEDGPRLVLALQNHGGAGAVRSRDLREPPALHRAPV